MFCCCSCCCSFFCKWHLMYGMIINNQSSCTTSRDMDLYIIIGSNWRSSFQKDGKKKSNLVIVTIKVTVTTAKVTAAIRPIYSSWANDCQWDNCPTVSHQVGVIFTVIPTIRPKCSSSRSWVLSVEWTCRQIQFVGNADRVGRSTRI